MQIELQGKKFKLTTGNFKNRTLSTLKDMSDPQIITYVVFAIVFKSTQSLMLQTKPSVTVVRQKSRDCPSKSLKHIFVIKNSQLKFSLEVENVDKFIMQSSCVIRKQAGYIEANCTDTPLRLGDKGVWKKFLRMSRNLRKRKSFAETQPKKFGKLSQVQNFVLSSIR